MLDIDSLFADGAELRMPEYVKVKEALAPANSPHSCAVVCVGKAENASKLLTLDGQLDSEVMMSLTREVHIPDFTAEKVTIMAEEYAHSAFDTVFEAGLWLKLMKFIRERYENLAAHGNGPGA